MISRRGSGRSSSSPRRPEFMGKVCLRKNPRPWENSGLLVERGGSGGGWGRGFFVFAIEAMPKLLLVFRGMGASEGGRPARSSHFGLGPLTPVLTPSDSRHANGVVRKRPLRFVNHGPVASQPARLSGRILAAPPHDFSSAALFDSLVLDCVRDKIWAGADMRKGGVRIIRAHLGEASGRRSALFRCISLSGSRAAR